LRTERQETPKWFLHLVADLHQPLHPIADDRGANGRAGPVT
jgi:hypothetical protein